MLKKLFGGIRMTWPRLILFALASGIVTGLIALLVPDGNSFRQIAATCGRSFFISSATA